MEINWIATGAGFVAAIALAFLWYGLLFGKAWAAGSHNITPLERFPVAVMATDVLVLSALLIVAQGLL